jgi:carboxyl-terminal processing protease
MKSLKRLLVGVCLLLACGFCVPGRTAELLKPQTAEKKSEPTSASWSATPDQLERLYNQVWASVRNSYHDSSALKDWASWKERYKGQLRTVDQLDAAVKDMLASLKDPYTKYSSVADRNRHDDYTNAQLAELGVLLKTEVDGSYVIDYVHYASPAYRADLRRGDQLRSINGKTLKGMTAAEVGSLMLGGIGDELAVTIFYAGIEEKLKVKLVPTPGPVLTGRWKDADVAYIRLPNFNDGEIQQKMVTMLFDMDQQVDGFIKGLILDVRGNSGGSINEAVNIAGMLLLDGNIVTIKERRKDVADVRTYAASKGLENVHVGKSEAERKFWARLKTVPLVVLTDELSASASEILVGALKDNKRAVIVGATTYGKGVGSSVWELENGAELMVRTIVYETPSGLCPSGVGITPDKEVLRVRHSQDDAQLKEALKTIKVQIAKRR